MKIKYYNKITIYTLQENSFYLQQKNEDYKKNY